MKEMKNRIIKPIVVAVIAIFVYLIFDVIWGVTSDWGTSDKLYLWQVAITGLLFLTAFASVAYAGVAFDYSRKKDQVAQERSRVLITDFLKAELMTNKDMLAGEYKIWSEADTPSDVAHAIGTRPLKVSAFELMMTREDLRYFEPHSALSKVLRAYDQIRDFNSLLELWFQRAVLGDKGWVWSPMKKMDIDTAVLTAERLNIEVLQTRQAIEKALEEL